MIRDFTTLENEALHEKKETSVYVFDLFFRADSPPFGFYRQLNGSRYKSCMAINLSD